MQSESRVSKLLRDARAEIARPVRPETPRDARHYHSSRSGAAAAGGATAIGNNNATTSTSSTSGAAGSLSKLPPLMPTTNNNNNMSSARGSFLPPMAASSSSSPSDATIGGGGIAPAPPVANAASSTSTRTATANSNSNTNLMNPSSAGFDVRPPVKSASSSMLRGGASATNRTSTTTSSSGLLGPTTSTNDDGTTDQAAASAGASTTKTTKTKRRTSTRRSSISASSSDVDSNVGAVGVVAVEDQEHMTEDEDNVVVVNDVAAATASQLRDEDLANEKKYKELILQMEDKTNPSARAKAVKEILSLLQFSSSSSKEELPSSSSCDTGKLRTQALEAALDLFRDYCGGDDEDEHQQQEQEQQQQKVYGWLAAKEAKLVDTALRYVECRPFGTVDFTVAVSAVKAAAEIPQCVPAIFTGGGIRVLKHVLDTAVERLAASSSNNNAIARLSVALTLQTLSFLSEKYSSQIVKTGICEPCVDLGPFVEQDDRSAAALCSLAAKLCAAATEEDDDDDDTHHRHHRHHRGNNNTVSSSSAVDIWRQHKYGCFAQRLCRCVQLRWTRLRNGQAGPTGYTLVARGLLAIALLIADGGTPLDAVAAESTFLTSLCEEFDDLANRMNPRAADDSEELVNALRVISGISVNSAGGHILSTHPSLKELVSDLLIDLEPNCPHGQQVLLLALVCISNFTFYCFQPASSGGGGDSSSSDNTSTPSSQQQGSNDGDEDNFEDHHHQHQRHCSSSSTTPIGDSVSLIWLENLLPSLLGILFHDSSSPEALVETTRALGNISRTVSGCAACRQHRIDEVVCAMLIHADPRIVYNCLGVVTNLSAMAINQSSRRSKLPWLAIAEEQVCALAKNGGKEYAEYPEVAELAEAAMANISHIAA